MYIDDRVGSPNGTPVCNSYTDVLDDNALACNMQLDMAALDRLRYIHSEGKSVKTSNNCGEAVRRLKHGSVILLGRTLGAWSVVTISFPNRYGFHELSLLQTSLTRLCCEHHHKLSANQNSLLMSHSRSQLKYMFFCKKMRFVRRLHIMHSDTCLNQCLSNTMVSAFRLLTQHAVMHVG